MYTEQQESLRSALWNFMGAILNSSTYEGDKGKQTVVALISEEIAKLCQDEEGKISMEIAKPILRNAEWILRNRSNDIVVASLNDELSSLSRKNLENAANEISSISDSLKHYTDKL